MTREKRLGRGLEALLGRVAGAEAIAEMPSEPMVGMATNDPEWALQQSLASQPAGVVDIMQIDRNPYQPRMEFDESELDTLSASLQTHGLLQPIVVRQVGERFQVIAGERRLRAAIRAGWSEVPVHLLTVDDRQMAELALTENIQRVDLNAIEKATAFMRYLEVYSSTHDELAKRLELDRSTVTNLLRLLELPEKLQAAVRKGDLTPGHARALLTLSEPEQLAIADRIVKEAWSVRQTERFVKELIASGESVEALETASAKSSVESGKTSPHLAALEQEFRNRLGTKVKLSHNNGKGKIVIPFTSHEEFERLRKMLCK